MILFRKTTVRTFIAVLTTLFLFGCSTMKVEDFEGKGPKLVLEEYFLGQTYAVGIFQDRFGNLRREFKVDIEGTFDGETLTLIEDFIYDDGEIEQRIWKLKKLDEHRYEGHTDGVIGLATGAAYGNAFNWLYTFDLKVGDGTWRVKFDDWMFLQPGGVLINTAVISKWGFDLGTVTLSFHKQAQAAENADLRAAE